MRLAARLRGERGVIGVSLIRWTIVLVLLGVVVIEAGSIIFTSLSLQNAADGAAARAAATWRKTQNLESAREMAIRTLDEREEDEARLVSIEADNTEPFELRITVRKQAATLIVHRIGFLKGFAVVDVDAEARAPDSGI
jgi:Flp pilus assembly protein TadG